MKSAFLLTFFALSVGLSSGQDAPLWLRYPAISPDGQTIVFSFKGDLFHVAASGGDATPLTLHEAHDFMPVWSHDGQTLAFASDRYGNFDVFVMPAAGGEPTRLTYYSGSDYPSDFTPDGKQVIFSSSRLDNNQHAQFPKGAMSELYQVPASGGRVAQILTVPALSARYSPDGNTLVYEDHKGTENAWRKHHTSSVTRDLWSYDFNSGTYTLLTQFNGEDRNPVFSPDGKSVYYLSESSGSLNVHTFPVGQPDQTQQITFFEKHPVRHLSISGDGTLCFSYDGEIYRKAPDSEPQKVAIGIRIDSRVLKETTESITKGATEMDLSPNGKEIAFVVRGEVFVTSVESGTTKRITNTPEQERSVSFSPDGRSLLYAAERNGSWDLFRTNLDREDEKYFFQSTVLKEEPLLVSEKETFQPTWSPDGKEVAFLEERTELRVINLETKALRTILPGDRNYSYSDGDQYYQWSPDGKWFLVEFLQPQQWISEVGLVSASGDLEVKNLTLSGYSDGRPRWAMGGKMMLWGSDRDGMRSHAGWGSEDDVYGMFFTQAAWDRYKLSEEDYKLLKEEEDKAKKDKKKNEEEKDDENGEKDKVEAVSIEWEGLEDRKVRLTIHSSNLSDAVLSKDGDKLYYLAKFEKGYDLWETELRTRKTKILAKLDSDRGGSLELDKEGKNLFMLAGGQISRIKLEDGKREAVKVDGEMRLNAYAERAYMFEHMWREVEKKFYVKDLHGVDWAFYKQSYARFLPYISNNYDFSEMASELLGELNASHTGCYYRPDNEKHDQTAALGMFYDETYNGDGLKVLEIMKGSPVRKEGSRASEGNILEQIDGEWIKAGQNYYSLLNRKSGKYTLLSFYDPESGDRWEQRVKPISLGEEYELRYKRWVTNRRELTEKLSDGKVGYVHVRGMDGGSFRTVYEEVLGRHINKEALIVDTRFNGGGWLHDDLATFLSGKPYLTFMPRGQNLGPEPQFKWNRPSTVIIGESNYSDAHMFPYTYKALGIGPLIGMPVPGTATAVWWENLQDPTLVFGIPQVGMQTLEGEFLENTQLEPDIKVRNWPGEISKNRDQQLEKAVEVLLKKTEERPETGK